MPPTRTRRRKKNKSPMNAEKRRYSFKSTVSGIYLFAVLFICACQTAVTPVADLMTPTPTPEVKESKDDFAEKLEYVRKGAFDFVYAFRRKDGAALDAEDRKYLRANSPIETNQWVVTEDAKAAIAGSNYQFPPASLEALKKRFNVEDLSPPKDAKPEENSNTNSEKSSHANN